MAHDLKTTFEHCFAQSAMCTKQTRRADVPGLVRRVHGPCATHETVLMQVRRLAQRRLASAREGDPGASARLLS